ncbi:MAG: PEGA domain-containing protein [Polyangiaceae bacterium]
MLSGRWPVLAGLLLLVGLTLSRGVAWATPGDPAPSVPEDADKLKADADAAMDHNEFQRALDLYEKSYALKKNPAVLYNEGRALQGLNRMPEALAKLRAFKSEASVELLGKIPKLDELVESVQSRVSTLALTVEPVGATVRLGDRVLGKAPLGELEVNAGDTPLEVSADGYVTDTRVVPLPGKGRTDLTITLRAKDMTGTLQVKSEVDGTHVEVDGKLVGQAPSETKLKAGEHRVVVGASGFEDHEVKVVVKAGEVKRLELSPIAIPLSQRPWFWITLTTGVLATGAGIGIVYALTTEGDPEFGTIPPKQVPVDGPAFRGGFAVRVPLVHVSF